MMQSTLLIVDSDVFQQQLIDMLLAVDNHKLITATTGREALEHLKLLTPQLIVLADNLPDTKGADLCARIRGVRRFQKTPIILTSSADAAQDVASLVPAVHASLALAKPLGNKRLREHVRELIKAAAPGISAAQVNEVQVDEVQAGRAKTEAHKPKLPQTFEVKDGDTALQSQKEAPQTAKPENALEKPLSLEPGMSEEEYIRSVLAKGCVVPLKEENTSKLSIFQNEVKSNEVKSNEVKSDEVESGAAADPILQEPATQVGELDENLLLTEADLTELTIFTDMDIESNVSPVRFEAETTVNPGPSFIQNAVEPIKVKAPQPIKLENFPNAYGVRVNAAQPKKLRREDATPLVGDPHAKATPVGADAPVNPKKPRKLNTLIEQPFGAQPSKRELHSPKPKANAQVHHLTADPTLEVHDPADEATRKLTSQSSSRLDSQNLLKEQELKQLSHQVETLLQENDKLKEAVRDLEANQPVGTSESYLDAVEELEALRRLSEHQGRQLTKLYGENRYLREQQQEPLKPEPPRKTIWDKLKL